MEDKSKRAGREGNSLKPCARKPYAAPALRVYGGMAALTRAVSKTTTNPDGGAMFNKSKTH